MPEYEQCGGWNWHGPHCCAAGLTCVYQNDWYRQCLSQCTVGDKVVCSGTEEAMCAGDECCPDGSTCPSASGEVAECAHGKTRDCTPPSKTAFHSEEITCMPEYEQ